MALDMTAYPTDADLEELAELAYFAVSLAPREACEAVDADLDIPVLASEVAAWVTQSVA